MNAEITVNFSNFAPPAPAMLAFTDPTRFWQALKPILNSLALLVLVGALGAALILFRRVRRVQAALAITLSLLMVFTPLLSSERTVNFFTVRKAEAAPRKNRAQRTIPPAR